MSEILTVILSVVSAIVVNLISNDLYTSAPRMLEKMLKMAAWILPEQRQDEYLEEWLGILEESPTLYAKSRHAITLFFAAPKLVQAINGVSLTGIITGKLVGAYGRFSLRISLKHLEASLQNQTREDSSIPAFMILSFLDWLRTWVVVYAMSTYSKALNFCLKRWPNFRGPYFMQIHGSLGDLQARHDVLIRSIKVVMKEKELQN